MNLLSVVLDWNHLQAEPNAQGEYFSYGPVSLRAQRIRVGVRPPRNFVFRRSPEILCGFIGYLTNAVLLREKLARDTTTDDTDLLAALYAKEGRSFFQSLEGFFTIFIWDFSARKGYVFQDENGYQTPLLYVDAREKILFSNHLKSLLKSGVFPRKLSLQGARDFLSGKVIIPNETTLIEGLRKLLPGQMLVLDESAKSMTIEALPRCDEKVPAKEARKNLIASVGEEVGKLSALVGAAETAAALSSGFDSNLMMSFLNKQDFTKITAVTIGGKKVNEIAMAARCAAVYPKVNHVTAVVGEERLRSLPDIVWKTEGHVFEGGLFLTHEFVKTLQKESSNVVFLGDGADQHLNPFRLKKSARRLTYEKFKYRLKQRIVPLRKIWRLVKRKKTYVTQYPQAIHDLRKPDQPLGYDTKKDYILKKSGVLLNSSGIQPLYPFLGRQTGWLAKSLSPGECHRKKFYKQEVRKTLGPGIAQYLKKIPGTIDIEFLCRNQKSLFEKLLGTDLVRDVLPGLDDEQKREMLDNIPDYTESLVHLLYLYLYRELFVTGRYDSLFDDAGIDLTVEDFFDCKEPVLRETEETDFNVMRSGGERH
jgi:asparagine synthase (glutamine-hydrolysing)